MLKPKATSERSTRLSNCQQAPTIFFEQWRNSNPDIIRVLRKLVCNSQDRGHCVTFCRLEDKLSHIHEKIQQLCSDIDEIF